jgi:hypothetical protein
LTPIEIPAVSPWQTACSGVFSPRHVGRALVGSSEVHTIPENRFRPFSRNPKMTSLHIAMGFLVYAIVFLPVAIASFPGVGIATSSLARPTSVMMMFVGLRSG